MCPGSTPDHSNCYKNIILSIKMITFIRSRGMIIDYHSGLTIINDNRSVLNISLLTHYYKSYTYLIKVKLFIMKIFT